MRRPATVICCALATAVLVAGCGGKKQAASSTTTSTATTKSVPVTAAEVAACKELGRNLQIVTTMTSNSVQLLTNSLHPKELAQNVQVTQQSLLYGAKVIGLLSLPSNLSHPRDQFVAGIRLYAADFGRAQKAVQRKDLAAAAKEMQDPVALGRVANATAKLTKICRPIVG
jgi:anion-transporting  ArsA/GET3 family ATPase